MLSQQREDVDTAILHYQRLLKDYPQSQYADDAQFMIAFIYEEYLGDIERARQAYQLVIDNYPDSELANSARHLLPYVGRRQRNGSNSRTKVPPPSFFPGLSAGC